MQKIEVPFDFNFFEVMYLLNLLHQYFDFLHPLKFIFLEKTLRQLEQELELVQILLYPILLVTYFILVPSLFKI